MALKLIKNLRKHSGLILPEALFAMSILLVASVSLGTIFNNGLKIVTMSKNFMIAENLAIEAIEGVKNIRDTNWLLNPGDETLWLCLEPSIGCPTISKQKPLPFVPSGYDYIIFLNNANKWTLEKVGQKSYLSLSTTSFFQIARQEQFRMYLKEEVLGEDRYKKYVSKSFSDTSNNPPSQFYRSIQFKTVSNEETTFRVRVQWKEGSQVRTVDRIITLYNY